MGSALMGISQHPLEVVPRLLDSALGANADLMVASRYVTGGLTRASAAVRTAASWGSTVLAKVMFPSPAKRNQGPDERILLVSPRVTNRNDDSTRLQDLVEDRS